MAASEASGGSLRPALAAVAGTLGAATFLHFWTRHIADPDLWGHLERGRAIVRTRGVPRIDSSSYSAYGLPFHNHEWIADLTFAGLFDWLGSAGLVLLKVGFGLLMVAGILDAARTLNRELQPARSLHPLTVVAVLVPAFAVIAPGATFRPQMFTMAILAWQWALLARADRRLLATGRIGWELAAIPPLLAFWANAHGGFLVGVGMLVLYAAAIVGRVLVPSRSAGDAQLGSRHAVAILAIAASGVLAPTLNPHGAGLYTFLAGTLDKHDAIVEWHPVGLLSLDFLRFKLLLAATAGVVGTWVYACAAEPRRRVVLDWRLPFLTAAAAYAFRHQRHTVLFAIAAAPVLMALGEEQRCELGRRRPELSPRPGVLGLVAAGALAIAGWQLWGVATATARWGTDIRLSRADYPVDAVEFLRVHGFGGNVATPLTWGAYTLHKLSPSARVFIDERFETVYPPYVIEDYLAFMRGAPGWERVLDAYPTEVVLVPRARGMHELLFERPDLVYVYSDPTALVFVRRTPTNAATLDRLLSLARRPTIEPPDGIFP